MVCRDGGGAKVLNDVRDLAAGGGPLLAAFSGEHVGEPRLLIARAGEHTLSELEELFAVTRSTVYRPIRRAGTARVEIGLAEGERFVDAQAGARAERARATRCGDSVAAVRNPPPDWRRPMASEVSAPPVVLIHGLWLTPRSWEGWTECCENRGHRVLAPAWPRMPGEVEDVRRDPAALNGLGLAEIVAHYEGIVRGLDRPPVIIGHSFGGLVTELLLDRGLGAAGVAISPAPVKGVLRLPPAMLRATFPVLRSPGNRNRTVALTPKQFHYNFTNTMAQDEAEAAYDRYHVPGPGRMIFQAAVANFNPRAANKVDFYNGDRPPLLVVGNGQDHTVPASVSKEAAKRLDKSKSVVDYREFAGRPHLAGAPGWEAVADYALDWADRHTGATAPSS